MVSAVVLAYNRCQEVLITIEKLKAYKLLCPFEIEIVVVDNASVDDTTERVRAEHPDIKLIRKEKNNGIAGWNIGFAEAKYEYLLVLDDDSHIVSGLTEAIAYLKAQPKIGILALNITSGPYKTDDWIWQNSKPWQDRELILGFFGCGAIIKKEVYRKIGGFAEWILVYAHEWEYGLRCMDAGYEIRYFKNSSIDHRASLINRSNKRMMIFGSRNEMMMVYKFLDNRWKYLMRMWFNNLKRIKTEGLISGYYYILGSIEFLKVRKTIDHTPVSPEVQLFFTKNYMNTFPILRFLTRRLHIGNKSSNKVTST